MNTFQLVERFEAHHLTIGGYFFPFFNFWGREMNRTNSTPAALLRKVYSCCGCMLAVTATLCEQNTEMRIRALSRYVEGIV